MTSLFISPNYGAAECTVRASHRGLIGGVHFDLRHEALGSDWICPRLLVDPMFGGGGPFTIVALRGGLFSQAFRPDLTGTLSGSLSPDQLAPGDLVQVAEVIFERTDAMFAHPSDEHVRRACLTIMRADGTVERGPTIAFNARGFAAKDRLKFDALNRVSDRLDILLAANSDPDPHPSSVLRDELYAQLDETIGRLPSDDGREGLLAAPSTAELVRCIVDLAVAFGHETARLEAITYIRPAAERGLTATKGREGGGRTRGDQLKKFADDAWLGWVRDVSPMLWPKCAGKVSVLIDKLREYQRDNQDRLGHMPKTDWHVRKCLKTMGYPPPA